jgi:hypothetical protein
MKRSLEAGKAIRCRSAIDIGNEAVEHCGIAMARSAHAPASRNRDSSDDYAPAHRPEHVQSASDRIIASTAVADLQSTMGNAFVARYSGVPAAPEVEEDDWWGTDETEVDAGPADHEQSEPADVDTGEEEGTGYGVRQPDDEGSQWTSGGGDNEMSAEDTPGGAESDQGAGYTSDEYGEGEVEANPQGLEKEEESSRWPFDDEEEEEPAEEDEDEGGSWWDDIFGGGGGSEPASEEDPGASSEKDPSEATEEEVEAEQDVITETETYGGTAGGSQVISPVAAAAGATMSSGFSSAGRTGTVPVQSVYQCNFNGGGFPRAFVGGGKTGPAPWAGGGGAGPKGNQKSGSITSMVLPDYSSHGNLWDNADAYVEPGTGTLTVQRDYITSDAGAQGNGWYLTPTAASVLEAHERKHVTRSKAVYDAHLDPMLARVADSVALGKGKTFWRSDAKFLLKQKIGWADALKNFQEQDEQTNGQDGAVDQEDQFGPGWPRNIGPGDLNGVHYDNRLVMNSERDPAVVGIPVDPSAKPTTP